MRTSGKGVISCKVGLLPEHHPCVSVLSKNSLFRFGVPVMSQDRAGAWAWAAVLIFFGEERFMRRFAISKLVARVVGGASLAVGCFVAASSGALASGYGMAGCGLGSIVIGPKPGIIQVFAATTNGSSYSQTFGITTGTSNCADAKSSAALMEQQDFIANNLAPLSKEMAQGQGEILAAFTQTLGCSGTVQPSVNAALQGAHKRIFSSPGAVAVLDATKAEIRRVPALASGCSKLI